MDDMEGNTYIRESYLSKIRPFVGKGIVKVITGMRRAGKSTIMDQMISELVSDGISEDMILKYDLESRNTPRFKDADDMYDSISSWASGRGMSTCSWTRYRTWMTGTPVCVRCSPTSMLTYT